MTKGPDRVNVLHVLHSLDQSYGGPIRAVLDLSARAAALGLESEILGFGEPRVPDNPFPPERIHSLPIEFPGRYCYSSRLHSWLKDNLGRFDGVVLHGMWLYPNWAVAQECWETGVQYACFPHGMLEPWAVYHQGFWKAAKKQLYWHWREQAIFQNARCVYFTTNRERELSSGTFHLGGKQLILVPYGVDVRLNDRRITARKSLIQPFDRKLALFLGRVHPKKNVEFLMHAWADAKLSCEWRLLIAGPGESGYLNRLRRLADRLRLEQQVQFLGFVSGDDKRYLLQRADWFLLPSKQENFGVAVLEAINHGCPVAMSDQVYIAESFHEKSEILPLDVARWTEFFRERMVDEAWRREVLRMDREKLLPRFHMDTIAADWTSTLENTFSTAASFARCNVST
jgi:glycosyltransferase involved in cell wall biosynthesis